LYGNLEIQKGQTLLIRGATSALGQAALNIAQDAGLDCIALTRSDKTFDLLKSLGATRVDIERPDLSITLPERKHIDRVLDLVGNTTLLGSLGLVKRGGRVCQAGYLAGLDPVER
jgi:NADPH2:quinone reductase